MTTKSRGLIACFELRDQCVVSLQFFMDLVPRQHPDRVTSLPELPGNVLGGNALDPIVAVERSVEHYYAASYLHEFAHNR